MRSSEEISKLVQITIEMVTDAHLNEGETALAIDAQGVYFYFKGKKSSPVLNDLNIAVKRGVIYSLLGPSGCGKTSLLKCITGQNKIKAGSLKIYGRAPGSKGLRIPGRGIGYMPQDLALYVEMTAEETLTYFGSLYFMKRKEIRERISFLIEFLALPNKKTTQIKYLSGGQQRRVSLAAALVHKPPLLVLDEPTVGVDPILRHAIWKHLFNLAQKERLTIIITTHYIEEARQAHVVGLMREGHMLAERNPEDLMKQYKAVTLEQVFLELCQNINGEDEELEKLSGSLTSVKSLRSNSSAENNAAVWVKRETNDLHKNGRKANGHFELHETKYNGAFYETTNGRHHATALPSAPFPKVVDYHDSPFSEFWGRFICLTNKNLLFFKRNIPWMVFQMLLPGLLTVVFCLCVGGYPFHLPVAVANMEKEFNSLAGTFLHSINNHTIRQKQFGNLSLALESVKNGESWAAIHINPEFSTCLLDRVLEGEDASNETFKCGDIVLYLDMSQPQISLLIYYDMLQSVLRFARHALEKFDKNPMWATLPLQIQDPPVRGSLSTSFTEYVTPGQILAITFIIAVCLTGLAVLLERKQGLLERTFVAGATAAEVLLSLYATLLLSLVVQVIVVFFCIFAVFNIPCEGPVFWVVICVLLVGTTGMSYGLFVSSICDEEYTAAFLALGSFFLNIPPSGIIWSVEGMPHYLRYFSYCLPLTLISDSLRSIFIRGQNITDINVWDGYLVCIGWTIAFMSLSILFFKIKK